MTGDVEAGMATIKAMASAAPEAAKAEKLLRSLRFMGNVLLVGRPVL